MKRDFDIKIEVLCGECKEEVEVGGEGRKRCAKCFREFHLRCFEKYEDKMFCGVCYKEFLKGKEFGLAEQKVEKRTIMKSQGTTRCSSISGFFRTKKFNPAVEIQNEKLSFEGLFLDKKES